MRSRLLWMNFEVKWSSCRRRYEYSRSGNPTRSCLERCLASLDGAKHAFTFASGLAGTQAMVSLLQCGDHIVAMNDLYGGTNRLLRKIVEKQGIKTSFVDATDPENVRKALQPNTKMVRPR